MSDLKKTFGYIISSQTMDNSLIDVGEIISRKGLNTSRKDCLQVLSVYGVDDIKKFTDYKFRESRNYENKLTYLNKKKSRLLLKNKDIIDLNKKEKLKFKNIQL